MDVPFTQVINSLLVDKRLSFKAKGIWCYIQSKPDDYDFSTHRMPLESTDKRDSIRTGIAELIRYGYLVRTRLSDSRMEYMLLDPESENPTQPKVGKSHSGKIQPVSNKENIKRKNLFSKPTIEEIRKYVEEIKGVIDPDDFYDGNEGKGWVVGTTKSPMKDWKAVLRKWNRNELKRLDELKKKEKPSRATQPAPVLEMETDEEREATLKRLQEMKKQIFK